MFDLIIKEAASRFGLGDKAGPIVQMLLAFMTNKSSGGISGFLDLFKAKGMGDIVGSWLGGGSNAKTMTAQQVESVLGGSGGLVSAMASKFGLGGSAISSALGYLVPSVIGKLTPGGSVPTSLTGEVTNFIGNAGSWVSGLGGAGVDMAKAGAGAAAAAGAAGVGMVKDGASAGGGMLKKLLPLIILAALALWLLNMCSKSDAPKVATDAAKSTVAATTDAAKAAGGAAVDATKAAAGAATGAVAGAADAAKAAAGAATGAVAGAAAGAADAAKAAAGAAAGAATTAVAGAADAAKGAADSALSYLASLPALVAGSPNAKIYFDSGKIDLPADTADKLKPILDYLKANAGTKPALSGYHDPTGNQAQNEELAKNRAKAVREMLMKAGVAKEDILMEKPLVTQGGGSNAEARRVEVTVRK